MYLLTDNCYRLSSSSFRLKYNNFGYLSIKVWLKGKPSYQLILQGESIKTSLLYIQIQIDKYKTTKIKKSFWMFQIIYQDIESATTNLWENKFGYLWVNMKRGMVKIDQSFWKIFFGNLLRLNIFIFFVNYFLFTK